MDDDHNSDSAQPAPQATEGNAGQAPRAPETNDQQIDPVNAGGGGQGKSGGGGGGGNGNGPKRPTETVPPDEAGDTSGNVDELRPDQRAAFKLAVGAGLLIAFVTLGLGLKFFLSAPWLGIPSGLDSMSPERAKAVVDNVKAMNDIAIDRVVKLFNAVVAQSLLPVFTTILGYIFGSRVGGNQKNG